MYSPLHFLFDDPANEGWVKPTGTMIQPDGSGNGFGWGQVSSFTARSQLFRSSFTARSQHGFGWGQARSYKLPTSLCDVPARNK